jgi:copper(I)-binding protein
MIRSVGALIGCALLLQWPAAAADNGLRVAAAWARPTPPGSSVGAVYLSIINRGAAPDRLLALESPIAAKVEIHQSASVAGMVQMRAVSFVDCPAGATVKIEPGGLHIMLLGLKGALVAGSSFPLTLQFRDAGRVALQVSVEARE